ncbi:MAG: GNAT family N-acetyltransferase [Chloroflexota bacterium]
MNTLRLVSERDPNPADVEIVKWGLYNFNMRTMNDERFLDIAIFLRDEANAVQGGILGSVWATWFHLEFLWIAEAYRHQNYGDQLMQAAEAEALAFGATSIYLETHSFQARPFYERHGFQVVGEIEDYPPGQTYYLLSKSLTEKA